MLISVIYSVSNEYIPNVELFFTSCAILGVLVGILLNVFDRRNGGLLNMKEPKKDMPKWRVNERRSAIKKDTANGTENKLIYTAFKCTNYVPVDKKEEIFFIYLFIYVCIIFFFFQTRVIIPKLDSCVLFTYYFFPFQGLDGRKVLAWEENKCKKGNAKAAHLQIGDFIAFLDRIVTKRQAVQSSPLQV